MEKNLPIQLPTVPTFIRVGVFDSLLLSLSDFTEEELRLIADKWGDALIRKSKEI